MMRLIDVDAFLEEFPELADKEIDHPLTLRNLLDEQPTMMTEFEYLLGKVYMEYLKEGEDDDTK